MVMLTLIQRMGIEPILCIYVLFSLLLLFSKKKKQTLTLSVFSQEWALTQHNFHSQMNIERKIVFFHLDLLSELTPLKVGLSGKYFVGECYCCNILF